MIVNTEKGWAAIGLDKNVMIVNTEKGWQVQKRDGKFRDKDKDY